MKICELSIETRYLYMGLWGLMDCQGLMEYHPVLIKNHVFPTDERITSKDVEGMILSLIQTKRLDIVEHENKRLIYCKYLVVHQKFHVKEVPKFLLPDGILESPYPTTVEPRASTPTSTVPIHMGNGEWVMGNGKPLPADILEKEKSQVKKEGFGNRSSQESDLAPLVEIWGSTKRHFGITHPVMPHEHIAIGQAARQYGFEASALALEGMRYEKTTQSFDPSKWVSLKRAFDHKNMEKFINLACQKKAAHNTASPENLPTAYELRQKAMGKL